MNRRQMLFAGATAALLPPSVCAGGADITLTGALALVPVTIGSVSTPVLFVVDTGAAVTVVDGSLAGALTMDRFLPKSGPARATATGLSAAGRTVFVRPVLADLRHIASVLGAPIQGLLGNDFLSGFAVTISYSEKRFLLDASISRPAAGLPMRAGGMPFVHGSVRVGAKVLEGEFGVDTGLDTGAKLVAAKAKAAFPGLVTTNGYGMSVEGAKPFALASVDFIRAGGWDISKPSVFLSDAPPPQGAGSDYVGTLGATLFAGRVLTLDYPGSWWSLSPLVL